MKLLVTGAGGFLGRHVVAAAIMRGHDVRALIRPASRGIPESWHEHTQIEIVRGDLRSRGSIDSTLEEVDVVVHLAATKTGDLYEQFGGTVIATENLLAAMASAKVGKLVMTSSFSVYEYLGHRSWSVLDEQSPLADKPRERDEYCQTKLEQERIVREHTKATGGQCVILRPGVIYDRDNLWTARLGSELSDQWWVRTGTFAPLPLTYVENCAEAVILAAEVNNHEQELTLNVVDDDTPSQRAYLRALREQMPQKPFVIPVPWTLMRLLARTAWLTNKVLFGGSAKMPSVLAPVRLHARCKPLRYSNARIKSALGWTPRYTWREAIERSTRANDSVTLSVRDIVKREPVEQPA